MTISLIQEYIKSTLTSFPPFRLYINMFPGNYVVVAATIVIVITKRIAPTKTVCNSSRQASAEAEMHLSIRLSDIGWTAALLTL
ncbi:hypothetical protein D3C75_1095010 [compost metagenome]